MSKGVRARNFALHRVITMCILLFVLCVSVVDGSVDATTTMDLGSEAASARVSSQLPVMTVMTTVSQEAASNFPASTIASNVSTAAPPASERGGDDGGSIVSDSSSAASDDEEDYDSLGDDVDRPLAKIAANISQNLLPLPAGASAALVKPTKYHYYPHNQHIYLLPECAIQQVCNAVYVRLNWTQPLCACPSRYRDPCSASLNSDDLHTTELVTSSDRKIQNQQRALTLIKTCEPTSEMRACRRPRDWSLLALQNVRTGKSHYLVICRCPDGSALDGPMSHDQPTYASVPGIRVYGMMCVQTRSTGDQGTDTRRRGRPLRVPRETATAVKRIARRMYRDVNVEPMPPIDR